MSPLDLIVSTRGLNYHNGIRVSVNDVRRILNVKRCPRIGTQSFVQLPIAGGGCLTAIIAHTSYGHIAFQG